MNPMTRPTQQVEAMARRVYMTRGFIYMDEDRMFVPCPWEEADDCIKQQCYDAALAALRALAACPPSRDVGLAANVIPITRTISKDDKGEIDFFVTRYEAEDILTAMLSAAVKEAEE